MKLHVDSMSEPAVQGSYNVSDKNGPLLEKKITIKVN